MDGGSEALIGFVVACRDAPELLEPLEAVLDEMSPFFSSPGALSNYQGGCRLASKIEYDSARRNQLCESRFGV
jgi:hypothetical protein